MTDDDKQAGAANGVEAHAVATARPQAKAGRTRVIARASATATASTDGTTVHRHVEHSVHDEAAGCRADAHATARSSRR